MDYNKFTIASGGLETVDDLVKEECFTDALKKIESERKKGRRFCRLSLFDYGIVYKELKVFLEANNYIVYTTTRIGYNGIELSRLHVEWVEEV